MKRKIITTADGSKTIQIEDWNEQYHSIHGAIQEANHVFIKHGLLFSYHQIHSNGQENSISIMEIGFGTGLNAFLTLLTVQDLNLEIHYTGIEAYPVSENEIQEMNYVELINSNYSREFEALHKAKWEEWSKIDSKFSLIKNQKFFKEVDSQNQFDLIYFDAFGARVQPDLWTEEIFQKMYRALRPNGVLVTYSAKGSVRRAMQASGFEVERLPGPPGKREMLRALKSS
ncbi:tRNA (5-methylaminomethyl-2-thiouridine)(34)-methyltransferase MnmD [Winogradskyella aurantiaca]|uniref:tRNA (5-methylaminomethyl-2-thiouridine)(34)-methyltransferase MnmD n=1 Tax=Winogradskyella aurantiaca TaxID=2219558 RepID=UPI000E1E11CD|nr:tRNA (5-methylaminomethyl-2-thiouridine)(34)-methyltransferase MnmD [Winogradskyella aurantiaca]